MPKEVSTYTATEAGKAITTPIFIAEIVFATPLRLSSRGEITWNGQTWTANGFRLDGPRPAAGGALTGRIILPNFDRAISNLIRTEGTFGKPCRIWQLFGAGPHAIEDAEQIFDGELDAVPEMGDWVTVDIHSTGRLQQTSPRLFFAPPVFNHSPAPGTVIVWEGERIEIQHG